MAPPENEPEQLPPHNIEAEQALIGALLDDSAAIWPQVRGQLKPEHFFEAVHARLYGAIETLAAAGKVASFITIKNSFEQDATLAEFGGTKYLAHLVAVAATPMSAQARMLSCCAISRHGARRWQQPET